VDYGGKMFAGFTVERVADYIAQSPKKAPVYAYRLAWGTHEGAIKSPWNRMLGAGHASDIDFYTGYEDYPFIKIFPDLYYTTENKPGRTEISNTIAAYLKNFLYTGNPNGAGLVKWTPWETLRGKDCMLSFDADANKAIVAMTNERFDKEALLAEMKANLPDEEWQILSQQLLKGRFFWEY
jgi:para-nitrobenzyl esterase